MADIPLSVVPGGNGLFAVGINLTGAAILTSIVSGEWVRPLGGTIIDGIACSYVEGGAGITSALVTFDVLLADDTTNPYELCNIVAAEPTPFTITLNTTAKFKYVPLAVGSPTTGIAPWLSGITAIHANVQGQGAPGATTDNVKVIFLGRRIAA